MLSIGQGKAALAVAVVLAALTFGVGAGSAGDPQGSVNANSSTRSDLNQALNRVMTAPDAPPGLSVLINRNGESEYFRRGLADVDTGMPPARKLHARIASVAKAFSGAIALRLVSRGKLKLNDTIGELLPNLLPKAKKVTLRHALQHTGGLPDYIHNQKFIDAFNADPAGYIGPREVVNFVRDERLDFKPGSRYEYSDTDNFVVGLMAEKVTGVPYERLVRRRMGRLAKLKSTTLPKTVTMPSPFMRGYNVDPGKPPDDISELINPAGAWASGGIVSTLPDLGRFFRSYVGGKLFGRKITRRQRQWVDGSSDPPGPGVNVAGLGLFRYRTHCGTVFGHTGSFPGYRAFGASSADGKRSIAFVANAQSAPALGKTPATALIRRAQVAAVCYALR
jgi:D-alanyl-D-alanine carboxypeptidase